MHLPQHVLQLSISLSMFGLFGDLFLCGIGLYVTRQLTEALGGSLWFVSKENEGTTFYISLP